MEFRKQLSKEVKAHRDKGRIAYLSCRTVVVKKKENFAKYIDITRQMLH